MDDFTASSLSYNNKQTQNLPFQTGAGQEIDCHTKVVSTTILHNTYAVNSLFSLRMLNHIYFISSRRPKSVGKFLPLPVHIFLNNLNSRALLTVPDVAKTWVNQLEDVRHTHISPFFLKEKQKRKN